MVPSNIIIIVGYDIEYVEKEEEKILFFIH